MIWAVIVVLTMLWLLSVLSSYTLGGFVYPLLVYSWFHSSIRSPQRRPAL